MTYQELQDILRRNQLSQGVPVALSLDQIISGIQGQYQPFVQQPFVQGSQGAQRFVTGPQTFEQAAFTPVAQSAPAFTPGAFNIEQFRYKEPVTVSDVVDVIGSGGDGGISDGSSGISVDDAGLATASNVSPGVVGALATGLGMLTGLPLGMLSNVIGKGNIADAINQQGYNSAVAYNNALVAEQSGLANTPENAAALSSLIDSLSSSPVGQTTATVGPSGTGGSAAQAAQEAAAAAAALGMSPAAIGAASQAAANAAIQGATLAEQAQAAQMAAASADAAGMGANSYGSSSTAVGAPTAEQSAQQADALADALSAIAVSTEAIGDSGGDSGGSSDGSASAAVSGDAGWANGGYVTKNRLVGRNPEGPDDGYGALQDGEYVIKASSVKKYGSELFELLNSGKIPKKLIKSLI